MKLTYNKWRLRKYTAVAETKAALRREMQHTASVKRGRSQRQQIPFGVRALESGIEVDGVWISGTNTPSSMPASPSIAAMKSQPAHGAHSREASSSNSEMSRIEIPQPAHGYPGTNHSSGPSYNNSTLVDRPVSSERQQKKPPPFDYQSVSRPTYQPRRSSQLRFSNSLDPQNSEALAALEGRKSGTGPKGKRPEGKPISLSLEGSNADLENAQNLTHQKNIVTLDWGLATPRAHLAVKIIVTRTSRSNLNGRRTVTFVPHLASLRILVPPTPTTLRGTSLSSSTLLQAIPIHIWMKWADCMFEIEKVG